MVYPHLTYGVEVWGNANKGYTNNLKQEGSGWLKPYELNNSGSFACVLHVLVTVGNSFCFGRNIKN